MSTLYVSDLDGTLLRGDQRTSAFTNETINALLRRGMKFSYATARSVHTAQKVTEGLDALFPRIVYNGAFIVDHRTQEILHACLFTKEEARLIWQRLMDAGVQPIVYCLEEGRERFLYRPEFVNQETREFLDTRRGDLRDTPVQTDEELLRGDAFYFTCIGGETRLAPVYRAFRGTFQCMFQRDIYSGAQWLEIMPAAATKAQAARRLAEMAGCDRIVAFGDSLNDLPLFEIADECYAVANAAEELKVRATAVISSNEEDGVARWLLQHFTAEI